MKHHPYKTDLPVMLPFKPVETESFGSTIKLWYVVPILALILGTSAIAQSGSDIRLGALQTLMRWMPLLLQGFIFNVLISVMAMAIGTGLGAALGIGQLSLNRFVRSSSWLLTQFFRNSPW